MDYYEVTFFNKDGNETFKDKFTRKSYRLRNKIDNLSKLELIGYNIINTSSNIIKKELKVDNKPPAITFNKLLSNSLTIVCIDEQSGCGKIFYGTSSLSFDCIPNILLKKNETINLSSSMKYVCAKVFDKVGNFVEDRYQVRLLDIDSSDFNYGINDTRTNSSGSNLDDLFGLNESDIGENDFVDDNESYDYNKVEDIPSEDDSTFTYSIIGAIVLLLIGVGSGGYYAYKKGYLNKQLEKLGLKSYVSNTKNNNYPNNINHNIKFETPKEISKGGKYDNHLNKLNSFIDKEISKGDKLFSKFDDSDESKFNNYENEKNFDPFKKKNISMMKTKDDVNDFYELSKKKISDLDIDKEKEEFEKYLKKKETDSKEENK
jgi:hypothetical protein